MLEKNKTGTEAQRAKEKKIKNFVPSAFATL